MQEVYKRVIVTNDLSCTRGNEEVAVVHACKCHSSAIRVRSFILNFSFYQSGGYRIKEVSGYSKIHHLSVSRIVAASKETR